MGMHRDAIILPGSPSPTPSLRSPFQSYPCGSESGGHPGGEEWLLHCHEWRGDALQLGKI